MRPITKREAEFLRHLAAGMDTIEIARAMGIKEAGITQYMHRVITKLDLRNRNHAVVYAAGLYNIPLPVSIEGTIRDALAALENRIPHMIDQGQAMQTGQRIKEAWEWLRKYKSANLQEDDRGYHGRKKI